MKFKYIFLASLLLFMNSMSMASDDEVSPLLVARKKEQTVNIETALPEEILPPVFKPYTPAKNEVVFSYTKAWINAVDPTPMTNKTGSYLPGSRGINQLIIYTPAYGEHTNTNEFGTEAIVDGNTVTELSGADSLIPSNGVVISGHGKAKSWINSSIKVGTKIFIDKESNMVYTYTTSESFIFESHKKISEAEQMLNYYRMISPDYNWKVPNSYINDAKIYLKKAEKNPDEVQKYSKLAIEAANDALKSVLPYKCGELKGVWLRPTEKTETDIINTLNRIKQAGIDNIFLETYYHGKTIYPSKTMKDYGFTVQNENFAGIDPLAIWIKEAHKRDIKLHTWFETFYAGNQSPDDNPDSILAKNPSWGNKLKKDISSSVLSKSSSEHNGYFLDPANPYVQTFITKLTSEIINSYKPDGINLDYIRYPNSLGTSDALNWGYTDYARNEFKEIYGIDPADITKNDTLWNDWCSYRREKVTDMVKKVGAQGRQSNIYISTVVFPDRNAALNQKLQDWKTWTTRGYVDAFTPLFLTCDSKMANQMMRDVLSVKSPNTDFYAGLFVTFMGGSEEDLIRQIHEARKVNAKGVILFDYAHLSNKYINTLSTSVFASHSPIKSNVSPVIQGAKKRKGWWIFSKD